jgi:hypothetical protein
MKPDALVFMIAVFALCLGGFIYCVLSVEKKKR